MNGTSVTGEFSNSLQVASFGYWIEAVRVLSVPGGLAALAAMLKAFMHRHDGKRFVLNGEKVETAGLSKKEIEQLLQTVAEKQAEKDVAWQQLRAAKCAEEDRDA